MGELRVLKGGALDRDNEALASHLRAAADRIEKSEDRVVAVGVVEAHGDGGIGTQYFGSPWSSLSVAIDLLKRRLLLDIEAE